MIFPRIGEQLSSIVSPSTLPDLSRARAGSGFFMPF